LTREVSADHDRQKNACHRINPVVKGNSMSRSPKCGNAMPPVYADAYTDQLDGVGKDGCFPVPDGPGLGVTYAWDFIKRHRTQLHEFK
jgi:hypothetical protein